MKFPIPAPNSCEIVDYSSYRDGAHVKTSLVKAPLKQTL